MDTPMPSRHATAVRIRSATPADRPAVTEMLARCSEATRLQRFLEPQRSFPERYLTEALAGQADHLALVAATPTAVVALASCRATAGATADLAVLVEDAWQRQGIGTCLLNGLLDHADRNGLRTLKATMRPEQDWIMWALRAFGACTARLSMAVLEVTMRREPHRARLPKTTATSPPEILAPGVTANPEARFAAHG
jgi:GNAT superfamily N-acetyltransferase